MIPGIIAGGPNAAGAPPSAEITFVGKKSATTTGATGLTVPVSSGLGGGSAAGASVGDYVIICAGATESTPAASSLPGGLTLILDQLIENTQDARQRVWAGTLTDVADAVFSAPGTGRALAVTIHVFQNVGGIEARQLGWATGSALANPPPIYAEVENAWLFAVGSGGSNQGATPYNDPSDLTDIAKTVAHGGTYTATILAGLIRDVTPGFHNPEAFTGFGTNASWSWTAACLLLLPVGVSAPAATAGATAYGNSGGTGNRTSGTEFRTLANFSMSTGSITGLWNGNTTENTQWFTATSNVGNWFEFDFYRKRVIDQITWRQSSTAGHGTWRLQGSNDGINWTAVGSDFTLGGATVAVHNFSNTTGYRFYRLLGISGTKSNGPYLREIEFRISP